MFKFNVFFKFKNGQIVEYKDTIDSSNLSSVDSDDVEFNETVFDVYTRKIEALASLEFFKDAEVIASSFGPLNI